MLRVVVDADGTPHDINVFRSLGKNADNEAVKAVRSWRFDPAKRDGQPVKVLINIEVYFECAEPKGKCEIVRKDSETAKE